MFLKKIIPALFVLSCLVVPANAQEKFITVQSTTSTQNSGLLNYILPYFTKETGIEVRVVAVGTGQALKNAANGDGDVLLVHAKADEERFVADGFGVERFDLMYNDFVVVGPASDPAGINGSNDVGASFTSISNAKASFVSRGDQSGTHKKELQIWSDAGLQTPTSGSWYKESGSGMGATLNIAASSESYTLTDRATWAAFGNKGNLKIVCEGDKKLFNQYGVILVNPEKHPHVKVEEGQKFINWLLSKEGQSLIASFKVQGEQMFFPNASQLMN